MDHIALFASGSGTNAERIISHFRSHPAVQVNLVLSNRPDAFVLERAKNHGIPSAVFGRQQFYESDDVLNILKKNNITFIVLAGFLWLVPQNILETYPGRILNIHPALLPKYGGKGMYGMKVHEAVLLAGETESGITIHRVNEKYDAGDIVFQARCPVLPGDTPENLATRIHGLEYEHYPNVIEQQLTAHRSPLTTA
jgi:phosphoribosylglycinamide formyltransferase 1